MPFPLLKLGALLLRTLAKPAASRISYEAGRHPRLSKLCIALGQINHNITQRIAVLSAGYKYIGAKPLNEEVAKKDGVSVLAEMIVFGVAGSIMIYEYGKAVEKEEAKVKKEAEKENLMREKREERFARIEDALNRIVEEELKIKEIEQEQRRPWFGL